jgi:hypothetical protein
VSAVRILLAYKTLTDTALLVDKFLHQLGSTNSLLQESAIDVMLKHMERRSLSELRRLAHEAKSEIVRERALDALERMNGENEASVFYDALHDTSAYVRGAAITWFAWRTTGQGEDALIRVVGDKLEYLPNRIRAAEGLLKRRSIRSLPAIDTFLHDHELTDQHNLYERRQVQRIVDSLQSIQKSSMNR